MRPEGKARMDKILDQWAGPASVLDVGSYDVNGNFRDIVTNRPGWQYTGVDLVPGPNVDVVAENPYQFPWAEDTFDVVISGYVMEHVEAIWLWIDELVRLLKPGGMLVIITHTSFPYHAYPIDCWRIMPDGMRYLFDRTGQLERYTITMPDEFDIVAVAWKKVAA